MLLAVMCLKRVAGGSFITDLIKINSELSGASHIINVMKENDERPDSGRSSVNKLGRKLQNVYRVCQPLRNTVFFVKHVTAVS